MSHATLSHGDAAAPLLLPLKSQFQEQPVSGKLHQTHTLSDEPG